jgi:CBS domain-containing protein
MRLSADAAAEAIMLMNRHQIDHVPVIEAGHLHGLLSKEDLLKWMSLHETRERDAAPWGTSAS